MCVSLRIVSKIFSFIIRINIDVKAHTIGKKTWHDNTWLVLLRLKTNHQGFKNINYLFKKFIKFLFFVNPRYFWSWTFLTNQGVLEITLSNLFSNICISFNFGVIWLAPKLATLIKGEELFGEKNFKRIFKCGFSID